MSDELKQHSLQDGIKAQIRETIGAKPDAVRFSQGHHDAIVRTLPAILSGMFRAQAELHAREIADLRRQVASLVEKDARRAEIIREAVDRAKGRAIGQTDDTTNSQNPAEHGGDREAAAGS